MKRLQSWGTTKGDHNRMSWILRIGAGVLLALGAVASTFAATADGKTAATAIALSTSSPATGSLTGSAAGSFEFFTFDYPGDGSVGTLTLNVNTNDPAVDNAVGVNVYQGANLLATMNALGSPAGTNSVTFSSTTPGPILVQVYNYHPSASVAFSLSLSGVAATTPAPTTPVAPTASPTPTNAGSSPNNPIKLTTSSSGMLPGNPAGSFVYFTVDYPGDGSTQSVTLNFSPAGADVANALIVNVYQNGNTLASVQATQAETLGQLTVSYSSTTAGPVLIQLANYNPSPTISFTISR